MSLPISLGQVLQLTSKHIDRPTRPTGVSKGGNISIPFSTLLVENISIDIPFYPPPPKTIHIRISRNQKGTNIRALLQNRTRCDIHIEEMNLLIPLRNLPMLIDPYQRILHLLPAKRGLVDPDVDGEFGLLGLLLQTQHEFALLDGTHERYRLCG